MMPTITRKLMLVLALGAAFPAAAQPAPADELRMLENDAKGGQPEAELLYGLALLEGRYGLKPDPVGGYDWIRRAAHEGDIYSQYMLGNLYAEGRGTTVKSDRAIYWWRQAAKGNNRNAQYRLGKAYLDGKLVKQDKTEAIHWLTEAAEQGSADAEYLIGKMYLEGDAVAQDKLLANDWLDRAARQGHSGAMNLLRGLAGAVNVTTMVERESSEELQARARSGDPQAEYELAMRYDSGAYDVEKDEAKALKWLQAAANHGNRLAMQTLVHVYNQGEMGVKPDPEQAAYWQNKLQQQR
jgi:TPR repeat protein